jgi:putative hydrolase of the HAD superfamily
MPTSWPSAVLVDLDNTLHDYKGAASGVRSALAVRIEHEHGVPRDSVLKRYEQLIADEGDAVFASGRDLRVARMRMLLDTWPETRLAEAAPFAEFVEQGLLERIRPFAGALDAYRLVEAKGRAMVLTEGYADTQEAIAERLGLGVDRSRFLATKPHNVRKKDGSAFRLACELLQVTADETVIIGDNWSWDILGAEKAGMWQVWIAADHQDRSDPPDRYLGRVTAFQEAPAFIAANWGARALTTRH